MKQAHIALRKYLEKQCIHHSYNRHSNSYSSLRTRCFSSHPQHPQTHLQSTRKRPSSSSFPLHFHRIASNRNPPFYPPRVPYYFSTNRCWSNAVSTASDPIEHENRTENDLLFLQGKEEDVASLSIRKHMNDLIQEEIRGYENLDHWEKEEDESLPVSHPPKNDETTSSPPRRPSKSMMELLATFDPDKKPQDDAPLEEIQLWLECFSQQETVKKFEEMLQNARERQDYASISIVQRQMLEWYQPLREKILEEQKGYFEKQKNKGANKYGPFLCTLQPEKLAIIASHEATMYALKMGGNGATLMKMALLIGDAIEAEVNVQRLLRQRMRRKEKTAVQTMDDDLDQQQQQQQLEEGREYEGQGVLQDDKIENEMNNVHHQEKKDQTLDWMYGPSHLQKFVEEMNRLDPTRKGKMRIARANRRAMQLLESAEPWTTADKVILGAVLIQMLLEVAKVSFPGQRGVKPAFEYEKLWIGDKKLVGYITMNDNLYKRFVEDKFSSVDAFTTRHKPMVVPPREWVGPDEGGYMLLQTEFMRAHGCHVQKSALAEADLRTVMDGLNALGKVPWAINKKILNVAQRCWDEGIALGDIPSRTDFELPPMPIRPEGGHKDYVSADGEFQRYRDALSKYRRVYQRNMDLRSLRCSALLKLNQAHQFKDFEKIYFPYNVDFRGRAYPVPPHLSNIGSDLCRGVLTFAESKPLGPRGLYWMKVHLANLAGNDKITFDQRAEFTENNMDNIRAAVDDPFGENRWWMTLDDPFQALATCHEIVNAIDSGDPENYQSSLPVHMDGSCNGLQHYAALGRDRVGGKAVNLCAYDAPQDVYSGVMREVIKRVAEEAERMLDIDATRDDLTKAEREALANNRAAKLTNGLIDRGVVKRTVMTSVYGVTYIGAKKQIQEKIEEKLEAKGYDIDEMDNEIYAACGYLARVTMDVMGDLFTGARQTMNWLATCARLISSQGTPVAWISPIGVPAVQPYRQKQPYTVVTLLQTVVLINNNANLPIHKQRQVSAFPPNYVHSLDSSHMLLTGLEMDRRGLTFSAVHDSFWTHACDIDEMNAVLRECFVDLYSRPLLEDLKQTWELQYPAIEFPDLPKIGRLDLNEVKRAPYFFQ